MVVQFCLVFVVVVGELQVAVICVYLDYFFVYWIGSDSQNSGKVFCLGVINGQFVVFKLLLFGGIVGGEVGRDDCLGQAVVYVFVYILIVEVDVVIVKGVLCDSCILVEV